jgi:diketogulonate reductase-like aldo/keto reductase
MRKVELAKTGEPISVIGQGTWGINRVKSNQYYNQWKQSLRKGIELGMNHIDTAEAYGFGKAEAIVGEVAAEYSRDDLFITSKLFPVHFTHNRMKKAAYNSLRRLALDHFDLYLVHWPSPLTSIEKHMKALEELVKEGKTRYIGVSNYSVDQFTAAQHALKSEELVTNQVAAHVRNQNHIHTSLPYYREKGVTMTAYSPLGHRGFKTLRGELREPLERIAESHKATIQQIAIAWLINMDGVITIPKALQVTHIEANAAAADITLTPEEMKMLSRR